MALEEEEAANKQATETCLSLIASKEEKVSMGPLCLFTTLPVSTALGQKSPLWASTESDHTWWRLALPC